MGARYATRRPPATAPRLAPGEPADHQPWPYQWQAAINEIKPNVVVLLAGRWEVVDREYQGSWTNILHPAFAAYVKSQLEQASQLVTATGRAHGVPDRTVHGRGGAAGRGSRGPRTIRPGWPSTTNWCGRWRRSTRRRTRRSISSVPPCPGGKFATTVHGVTIRMSTVSTSPTPGASTWRRRSCRRSWRPGGRRWRAAPPRPQPAGDAGRGFTFWGRAVAASGTAG